MDFKDAVKGLGSRILTMRDNIKTEEATKNAFIMPFLQILGYDVFNPLEIVPEYTCDIGTKKGERIDYAVFKDGQPMILVECKHWEQNLDLNTGQLLRYFHVSKAKFGILTNGIIYRFYSDLDEPNKMDSTPFLAFDITEINENQIEELKKFHKTYFDLDSITNTASDLKYTNSLKNIFMAQFANPSEDFVKFFASQVYNGRLIQKVLDQFTVLVKRSFNQIINDMITERLKNAMMKGHEDEKEHEATIEQKEDDSKIITTAEELESYYTIRAMLRPHIDPKRIFFRDTESYFDIILDNSNRKPLCRLFLGGKKKSIVVFGDKKTSSRHEIQSIDDVFPFADEMVSAISYYDNPQAKSVDEVADDPIDEVSNDYV